MCLCVLLPPPVLFFLECKASAKARERAATTDLTRLVRNFWWGPSQGKRETHWLAWPKILAKKIKGDLGFRDFRPFNQALLARHAWRLLTNLASLCVHVLKDCYFLEGRLEDMVLSGNASPTWQAIQYALELLKKGIV